MPRTDRKANSLIRFGRHVAKSLDLDDSGGPEPGKHGERVSNGHLAVFNTLGEIQVVVSKTEFLMVGWSASRRWLVDASQGLLHLMHEIDGLPKGVPDRSAVVTDPATAGAALLKLLPEIPELRSVAPVYERFLVDFQREEQELAAVKKERKEADAAHEDAILAMEEALSGARRHLKRLPRHSAARKHYEKWWARRKKKDADTETETE